MNDEDRRLFVESIAEMRELKGEMREFKIHVQKRIDDLEKLEAEKKKERISIISIIISAGALAVAVITNILKHK